MSAAVEALLRAALGRTRIEAFVWNLDSDTISRLRPGGEVVTSGDARTNVLGEVDPEDRGAFERVLQQAIEAHTPLEHEYRVRGRWLHLKAAFDDRQLVGTVVDVTAEVNRRGAFEQITENMMDMISRVDLEGRFLYLNRANQNNVGVSSREDLIGKTPAETGTNPASAQALRAAELRLIATGEPQRLQLAMSSDDGVRGFDVLMIPERDESGELVSILRVSRDVTALTRAQAALRESEERLRLATRASVAMIYDWNMVTNETSRSDAVRELTGFSPGETQSSDWWIADIHPDDVGRAEERVRAAIDEGEDHYENEYRVRHRDGSWRWVWDRGFIIRDEAGHAVRAVGSTVDVTARRTAEEELKVAHRREQEARAEAERANAAKDQFLATLSHELRTPMSSILGWTSMMANGMVEPRDMPLAISSIHESAQAQAQLIEDLLDVSRIATGKLTMETRPLDLVAIIASAVKSFAGAAAERSLDLHVTIEAPDIMIAGDEKRMRQIVTNLISNALKFTPPGGRVDVALRRDGDDAIVTVRDTGIGITPEFLPYAFDRFAQQHTGDTRAHRGLGLGLAIVRDLVELHGGTVRAESGGAGLGSLFTVRVPRIPATFRPSIEPSAQKRVPRLDGVHVLLIEDEWQSRTYMESLLTSSGAKVRAASSVEEAWGNDGQGLDGRDPLVVVSDIAMPGLDGLALIAKVRTRDAQTGRRTPAVAVTALGFGDDRRRILSAGFDEYLAKPVEPTLLLATVAALAGR